MITLISNVLTSNHEHNIIQINFITLMIAVKFTQKIINKNIVVLASNNSNNHRCVVLINYILCIIFIFNIHIHIHVF